MRMKWVRGLLIGVLALIFLGSVTAYAAPNYTQKLIDLPKSILNWSAESIEKSKSHISSYSSSAISRQMPSLVETGDELLTESELLLGDYSLSVISDKTKKINTKKNTYLSGLEKAKTEIFETSDVNFDMITEKANLQSASIMTTFDSELESELNIINSTDGSKLRKNQKNVLGKEIKETQLTIKELEKLLETEENKSIKEYIQKKITFLNELIMVISED